MPLAIHFHSRQFDFTGDKPNPYNPIHGLSLGNWFRDVFRAKDIGASDVEAEDWGWYLDADYAGRSYMVGFCAFCEEDGSVPSGEFTELIVQVEKHRSFTEQILSRNKMDQNDPMLNLVHEIILGIEDVKGVEFG